MLKNAYFLEKTAKSSQRWGIYPRIPAFFLSPTITTLSSLILALNALYYPSKNNKITAINVLISVLPHFCSYLSIQILQFWLTGVQEYFLP